MAPTTAQHIPVDIDSEDSVFKRIFSDEQRPRKLTMSERLANIFADTKTTEKDVSVSDFLPSY